MTGLPSRQEGRPARSWRGEEEGGAVWIQLVEEGGGKQEPHGESWSPERRCSGRGRPARRICAGSGWHWWLAGGEEELHAVASTGSRETKQRRG
jgi:hypothetical protein